MFTGVALCVSGTLAGTGDVQGGRQADPWSWVARRPQRASVLGCSECQRYTLTWRLDSHNGTATYVALLGFGTGHQKHCYGNRENVAQGCAVPTSASAETRKSEPVNFIWHCELRTMSAEHASGLWPDTTGRAWREYREAGTCWAARGNRLSVSRSSKIYKTKQNKIENRWGSQIQGVAARPLLRKSKAIKPARQELLGFLVVLSQSTPNA